MIPIEIANSLIALIWLAWVSYWFISARGTKNTMRRESRLSRVSHILPLACGVTLIAMPRPPWGLFTTRILPPSMITYWAGVALLVLGLAFTVYARAHLGQNWSATVTLKEGHELIRTGPYGWVRHPIYTGLLTGLLGCAIARGELRGAIGFVLATLALIRKLRIEESWMREQFGEAYDRYSAEVPALIPSPRSR